MFRDRKVLLFGAYRAQMLYKTISESPLGLTDVVEATSGAVDGVDLDDGCAGEHLSDIEGNVISEASDEVMLFYSTWNLYCPVRN
eukprot:g32287.t1